jgi:hypothetical protein
MMLSAEPYPDVPAGRRRMAGAARSLRIRLAGLVKLAAVGGLAFAVGVFAMIAMSSLGWGAGLLATVSGPMLIASVIGKLYAVSEPVGGVSCRP